MQEITVAGFPFMRLATMVTQVLFTTQSYIANTVQALLTKPYGEYIIGGRGLNSFQDFSRAMIIEMRLISSNKSASAHANRFGQEDCLKPFY